MGHLMNYFKTINLDLVLTKFTLQNNLFMFFWVDYFFSFSLVKKGGFIVLEKVLEETQAL